MSERPKGLEQFIELSKKTKETLRSVLAEILRTGDLYLTPMRSGYLSLKPDDIPPNYVGRNLIDIGSAEGGRYKEIELLFHPKSYIGVDKNARAVSAGRRRNLEMRQIDFVNEQLEGDLGVMFGTYTTPEVVKKLGQYFNLLVFTEYAENKKRESEIIEQYKDQLGEQAFDKILSIKRSFTEPASGYGLFFFYKPRHEKPTPNINEISSNLVK